MEWYIDRKNRRTRRRICPSATLFTTNPTWIDLDANPALCGERPVTNDLSHDRTMITHLLKHTVGLLWTSDQPVTEDNRTTQHINTGDKHPCPEWDSTPRSQQPSGRRPTSYTTLQLGLADSSQT
jgi:hypothetical protein